MVKRRKPIDRRSYNRMRSSKKTRRRQAEFSTKKIKKFVVKGSIFNLVFCYLYRYF